MDYDYINELKTPFLQPPPIVFRIVWPILYILMFLSLYIFLGVGVNDNTIKTKGIIIFIIQLTLNLIWSPIFFYYKKIFLAFCVAAALTAVVLVMIVYFYRVLPLAGLMNIPYFVWLLFADYLNFQIWLLNRN
ncbi:MAG: tryptophan-rich sensory protein [Cyanobacteria bacterium RUI128]|nr:tryptophan-rich sensory protein [Cyanobacteria bacterium RUI128]